MRRIALLIVTVLAGLVATSPAAASDPPTYAYYYIWFSASSWNRAKTDYSKLGRYSSDEQRIMRQHIRWAKQTGIDGWIVSWKDTPVLTDRLEMLATIAAQERFKLSVIYQGLDFERRPLQPSRVGRDIDTFLHRFGRNPVFAFRGRPLIIWSGTWKFTADQIASVTENRRRHVAILATERNAVSYEAKADAVDGDAYYWSSLNPYTYPDAAGKLRSLSTAVDRHGGLWIAPAAPGFDARKVGGTEVVPRKGGETLRKELELALGSFPDMLGIISWNEFSENSQVEPSVRHGFTSLEVLADVLKAPGPRPAPGFDSSAPAGRNGPLNLMPTVLGIGALFAVGGALLLRRSRRGPAGPTHQRGDDHLMDSFLEPAKATRRGARRR